MELTDVMNASKKQANKKKIPLFPSIMSTTQSMNENPLTTTPRKKDVTNTQRREPLSKITSSQTNISSSSSSQPLKKPLLKPTTQTTNLTSPKQTPIFIDKNSVAYKGLIVYDRIFVGGQKFARNYEKLTKKKIQSVLNVSKEVKCYYEDSLTYLQIPVADSSEDQIIDYFDEAANFISTQLAKDDSNALLVHCKLGQCRSTSVLVAYAMKEYGWTLEKAYSHMYNKHPNLQINDGFKIQLMKYEVELFGKNSFEFFRKRISKPVKQFDPSEYSTPRKSKVDRSITKTIRKNNTSSATSSTASNKSKNNKLLMLR